MTVVSAQDSPRSDVLRDEREAYGRKLGAAGDEVPTLRYSGTIQDFGRRRSDQGGDAPARDGIEGAPAISARLTPPGTD